jgi:uncharacterized protein YbcC (UPF0753/DUF2309 family)
MSTLAKTINWEKVNADLDLNIHDLVKNASNVIAPLGPINTFAARHPWEGLEEQTFEEVARRLNDTCDVNIYPDQVMAKTAWKRGEIDKDFLEKSLYHWLHSQNLEIPFDAAEEFCKNALMGEETDFNQSAAPEVKSLAKKLNRYKTVITKKHSVQTFSQQLKLEHDLNRHIIKWCKLYLDESQAVWSMPNREKGFYQAWRELVSFDPALNKEVRKQLQVFPKESDQALKSALFALNIPSSEIQEYLEAHLLSLPGWAGMMLWRSQRSAQKHSLVLDYLAVRLSMEYVIIKPYLPVPENKSDKVSLEQLILKWASWGKLPIKQWPNLTVTEQKARLTLAYRFDWILRNRLWLEAWEKTYENRLKDRIQTKQQHREAIPLKASLAQFVFCIDVRSEPFRYQLENAGPFETFGTAGFFGLPIEACELGSEHGHDSLPVMFKPKHIIKETTLEHDYRQYEQRKQAFVSLGLAFNTLKHNLLTSLVLPEISGPWLSLRTLARSFVPRSFGSSFRKMTETWLQKPLTKLALDHTYTAASGLAVGFTEKEKVDYCLQALKTMGLTDHFSPLVVICGHGSHSTNNPYKSSLDCGACGGASSAYNARVLATLCNLPGVRRKLANEGISIPEETVFAAAEHITTLDELRWVYVPELSKSAKEAYNRINDVLPEISVTANAERTKNLSNHRPFLKNPKKAVQLMAEDWSEIRPEWGLARNAAFIIGERRLTQECDLEGRVFLQNYSWRKDKSGTLLSNIINGPATVAQWINLQYYASTVAPHYYGSGSKATQTVSAGLGVMQGNASDLLPGLPWQSVMQSDQEAYHAPLRLLVVIQAPKEHVKRLLDTVPAFQQKVKNGWIRLASIGPEGNWENWS